MSKINDVFLGTFTLFPVYLYVEGEMGIVCFLAWYVTFSQISPTDGKGAAFGTHNGDKNVIACDHLWQRMSLVHHSRSMSLL